MAVLLFALDNKHPILPTRDDLQFHAFRFYNKKVSIDSLRFFQSEDDKRPFKYGVCVYSVYFPNGEECTLITQDALKMHARWSFSAEQITCALALNNLKKVTASNFCDEMNVLIAAKLLTHYSELHEGFKEVRP